MPEVSGPASLAHTVAGNTEFLSETRRPRPAPEAVPLHHVLSHACPCTCTWKCRHTYTYKFKFLIKIKIIIGSQAGELSLAVRELAIQARGPEFQSSASTFQSWGWPCAPVTLALWTEIGRPLKLISGFSGKPPIPGK